MLYLYHKTSKAIKKFKSSKNFEKYMKELFNNTNDLIFRKKDNLNKRYIYQNNTYTGYSIQFVD
jgi:hypothetical protein